MKGNIFHLNLNNLHHWQVYVFLSNESLTQISSIKDRLQAVSVDYIKFDFNRTVGLLEDAIFDLMFSMNAW